VKLVPESLHHPHGVTSADLLKPANILSTNSDSVHHFNSVFIGVRSKNDVYVHAAPRSASDIEPDDPLRGRRRCAADFRALDAAAEARGIRHHSALRARQALASAYPVPDVGPLAPRQAIYEAFAVGSAISPVKRLIEDRTPRPASAARGAAGRGSSCASLSAKAESAGRTVIALNLRHTSQRCAECGRTLRGTASPRQSSDVSPVATRPKPTSTPPGSF
jgi:hypothetical protein